MGQKSTQERTKNRSIFETNFKRLPGAILVENDVQLGAKNGRKRGLKHPPARVTEKVRKSVKNEASEIGKILILPLFYKGFIKVTLFYRWSKDHRKSVENRSKNAQKMKENIVRNETKKQQQNKIQIF